ncbi:MAG: DUF1573 domain-containing protein [Elusimicrobiota bacterium]
MRSAPLLFPLLLLAAPLAAEPKTPRLVFDEKSFDFGPLVQGATVQHDFAFRNAGRAPLEIYSADSSCGCTAALPENRLVKPGGRSRIRVTYDSRGKMGPVEKFVAVRSNDPESPVTHLVVRGLVTASQHPEMTGTRNLFEGSCASCHADRGRGRTGEALYQADCAMCHEHHKIGRRLAPPAEEMASRSEAALDRAVREGLPGTSMPAFHSSRGGPLNDAEIESLVRFLKSLKNSRGDK